MSLVAGEDSESSDEEINTDQLPVPKPGIVTGEDDEDEEEDEEEGKALWLCHSGGSLLRTVGPY